mmetsp:Transcript_15769/g.37062  ORF Transcript_15769/g.37062 Transcript_15769/m.37062 type:complete len:272 (-) Transcript_15769:2094-2909(-)
MPVLTVMPEAPLCKSGAVVMMPVWNLVFKLFSRAVMLTPSPMTPYFMRVEEPKFPTKTSSQWTPMLSFGLGLSLFRITSCISTAAMRAFSVCCATNAGALKIARTSSPMNSRTVPSKSSTTVTMICRTLPSKTSICEGGISCAKASMLATSTKRIVTSLRTTPNADSIPASTMALKSSDGTYLAQDRMAPRRCRKEVSSFTSSSDAAGIMSAQQDRFAHLVVQPLGTSADIGSPSGTGSSAITSRHLAAHMSSKNFQSGCSTTLSKMPFVW